MVKVELNGSPYQCAACKEELTIGQYQRIIKEWGIDQEDLLQRDNFGLFSILTKSPFRLTSPDNESEEAIYEAIMWAFSDPLDYKTDLPKVLKIGNKEVEIPKKVGALSIGQNILLKQIIEKSKYLNESLAIATAIYLQPLVDGKKFDYARAKNLEREILEMPAELIYPVGFFFLYRAKNGGKRYQRIWPRIQSSLSTLYGKMLRVWHKSKSYTSTTT